MSSRDLFTVPNSNGAVAVFLLLLLPHIIHHSLTVHPPDSLINLKQWTDWTKIHQSETKALVEKCPPPCFVTVELFSVVLGAEGIYCEVHKTFTKMSIVPTKSSVWPRPALLYVGFETLIREMIEGAVSELVRFIVGLWRWLDRKIK